MAQWLRALAALLEDSSSIPSTHVTAHNCLQLQSQGIQYPLLTSADIARSRYLDIYTGKGKIVFTRTQRNKPHNYLLSAEITTGLWETMVTLSRELAEKC